MMVFKSNFSQYKWVIALPAVLHCPLDTHNAEGKILRKDYTH